ncbi:MAG TPA: tetratricopeptide repeat protein [Candidatus Dormibacteraeota bacterium]|nr:tetratricopeptide repeat protein [Candidatus Dormibacteraeota bacterium]
MAAQSRQAPFSPAEFLLGTMYRSPAVSAIEENPAEAARWYRRAAQQGYAPAQNNLGILYDDGIGVPANNEQARKWYRLAAEQGDGSAAANLAYNYASPHNAKLDLASAYFWALLALHYPPLHSPPLQAAFAASLRARLSPDEASRVEAQAQDWIRVHASGMDTVRDDWFTLLFAETNDSSPE